LQKGARQVRLLICAGGTGGGVYPALTVTEILNHKGHALLWVGSEGGMEKELVERAGLLSKPFLPLASTGFRSRSCPVT
jgi:UDP-N-acetylglucosamine--N-acetylmuramyl-(pentapeptide) pyrophosphoryl-undecaprenol N-acetylglucosamine transferase